MLDAIGEEAFVADRPHFGEHTTNATREEINVGSRERRRFRSAEKAGSNGQVKLVDEIESEQGAE